METVRGTVEPGGSLISASNLGYLLNVVEFSHVIARGGEVVSREAHNLQARVQFPAPQ